MRQIQNILPAFLKGVKGILWIFEFEYYLLFVNWCLEFTQFKDSAIFEQR